MKKVTTIIIIASLSMLAMAQQQEQQAPKFIDHYTLITAGISGMQLYSNVGEDDMKYDNDMFAPGATIGFTCGSKLGEGLNPVSATYIEIGAELSFNDGKHRTHKYYDDVYTRLQITSLTVPVSLCYKRLVTPRDYRLALFAGISPKENLIADMIHTYKESDNRYEYDMFSEGKMGTGYTAKHFEFGIHAGVGFEFDNVSIRYKCDFAVTPFHSYEWHDKSVNTKTIGHLLCISYIMGR